LMISRPDGSLRPLAIPTIRDRVAQMAVKLMIEPIFEADLSGTSYGFRLMRSAHDAAEDMTGTLWKDYTNLIDADLSKYYDTIPHDKLLHMIAGRIVDSGILQIVKLWLNAPVIDEEESGCAGPGARKNVDGTKGGLREKFLQC
jgi:RNA-directed DNA polymerase